jgi:hypothetical protein
MCYPMMDDGGHAGITDQDFREVRCGGIANEGLPEVTDKHATHFRQRRRKGPG